MELAERRFSKNSHTPKEEIEESSEKYELDAIAIACEISNYNALEFKKILWSVSFGYALIIFREKRDKELRDKRERMKFELTLTDIMTKVWGADLNLIQLMEQNENPSETSTEAAMQIHEMAGAKIIK